MSKAEKFKGRFLNKSLIEYMSLRGEYALLFEKLSVQDVDNLVEKNVFFSMFCYPASNSILRDVPKTDIMNMIQIGSNVFTFFLREEIVAMFLHEIGHILNPVEGNGDAEFAADDFAVQRFEARWIKSGLRRGLGLKLDGFDEIKINERIARI